MPIRRSAAIRDEQLKALLARYEAGTRVDADGSLHFLTPDTQEHERILPDAFDIDSAFTRRQGRHILRRALRDARKAGPLTIAALEREAQRLARERLALPPRPYAMWTKFRAGQMAFHPGFSLSWRGITLESRSDLPEHMYQDDYFLNGHGDISPGDPAFFGYLIARGEARDEESAADMLMDAMDIFMAVFNLHAGHKKWSGGSNLIADGKLWSGPYHFLYEGEQFLGHDQVWFDPFFDLDAWRTFAMDMGKVLPLIPRVTQMLDALAEHPIRELLLRVLRPMQDAMISRDEKFALLRYWSALEQLYGEPNSRTKDYRRIINRATFADPDKMVARWKLGHISNHRNEYVHAGGGEDDLRVMARHLQRLLSQHVHYLLFHAPWVRSHEQWLEFADLADDADRLEATKTMIDRRIELIRLRDASIPD